MRYAMFSSEPMSFAATSSSSGVSRISFSAARPIRPRPLIATFAAIFFPPLNRNLDRPVSTPNSKPSFRTSAASRSPVRSVLRPQKPLFPPLRNLPYLRLMLDLPDKGFQSPGVVVFCVLGAEEERDVLLPSPLCDVAYVSHLARLFQFGAVALFELLPAFGVVAEPLPKIVARREILSPIRELGFILRDSPGPDAVHEDTPTVILVRLLIHPLDLDVHVPLLLGLRVARELLRADTVIVDSRLAQRFTHRIHHCGRAIDVVNGERKITNVFQEHGFGDIPGFPMPFPARFLHLRHRADKGVVRVFLLRFHQLVQKRCILRPSIGIKDKNSVRNIVVNSLKNDAPDRRSADTARQEDSWDLRVVVERERAIGSIQRKFRAKLHVFQYALERRIAHPCRQHKIVFVRSARQRKSSRVAFGVGFRWVDQGVISKLPCFVGKSLRLLKMKSHRSSSDFLSALKFCFVDRHCAILLIFSR